VSGLAPLALLVLLSFTIHASERGELIVASSEKLIELVIVQLVGLFVVVVRASFERLGLEMSDRGRD
jgi:hypothetical protein